MITERDIHSELGRDLFCHQFILGPEFVNKLVGWQNIDVSDSLKLTLHQEVTVEQKSDGNRSITLIGFILDPQNPDLSDADIVLELLNNFSNIKELPGQTAKYGGRWIIIAQKDGQSSLFNDALGLRQICYTTPVFTDGLWAMSQPGLLAWLYDLKPDAEAERFVDSYQFRSNLEYRWPGIATAFREINHLLPNHYLDLSTGINHRFWPYEQLQRVSFAEGINRASDTLRGLMQAAHRRFELVIGITAGVDSRIVLAASKGIRKSIAGVTVRQGKMRDDHQDLTVPSRLLGNLAMPHQIIKALPYMSGEFSQTFKQNVFLAHDHYGPDVEAILGHYSRHKVVATGSGSEVAKVPFREYFDSGKSEFTANDLAGLQRMEGNKFAEKYFHYWLEDIGNLYGVELLDLFCWEQSHGNWLAGTQMEFDLAWQDIFTPFNCRELLACLLSIDTCHRVSPDYSVHSALIENMWPELLQEPVNPDKEQTDSQSRGFWWRIVKAIKKSGG